MELHGHDPVLWDTHQPARRRLAELSRRSGWRLPRPAALALEHRARGALAAVGG